MEHAQGLQDAAALVVGLETFEPNDVLVRVVLRADA
jgi:hypothetical protein